MMASVGSQFWQSVLEMWRFNGHPLHSLANVPPGGSSAFVGLDHLAGMVRAGSESRWVYTMVASCDDYDGIRRIYGVN